MKKLIDLIVCVCALLMLILGVAVTMVGLTDALAKFMLFGVAMVVAGVAVWKLNSRNDFIMFINRMSGLDMR